MKKVILAIAMTLGLTGPVLAQDEFSNTQKDAIGEIVRDYILENPEIITEAFQILQQREEMEHQRMMTASAKENLERLHVTNGMPMAGNPDGDITIVEFFDYRCPYCRAAHSTIDRLVEEDGNIQVIFRHFPVKDQQGQFPASLFAAQIANIANSEGKFQIFHDLVMEESRALNEAVLMDLAYQAGLDMAELNGQLNQPAAIDNIRDSLGLARDLGVRSTPTFFINGNVVVGAVSYDQLRNAVALVRAGREDEISTLE